MKTISELPYKNSTNKHFNNNCYQQILPGIAISQFVICGKESNPQYKMHGQLAKSKINEYL